MAARDRCDTVEDASEEISAATESAKTATAPEPPTGPEEDSQIDGQQQCPSGPRAPSAYPGPSDPGARQPSPFVDQSLQALSTKELKSIARALNVNIEDCVEKSEIIGRIQAAQAEQGFAQPPGHGAAAENPELSSERPRGGSRKKTAPSKKKNDNRSRGQRDAPPADADSEGNGDRKAKVDLFRVMGRAFPDSNDAVSGTLAGAGTIVGGVATSVAAVGTIPVSMAEEGGIGGFFQGIGYSLGATLLIIPTSVYLGVRQAAVGIVNTPSTIYHLICGEEWDDVDQEWVPHEPYTLSQETERVRAKCEHYKLSALGSSTDGNASVADTLYYDLLKVEPTASAAQIKKAYRREAVSTHPDKNIGDPDAHANFQRLGRAYKILSDPELRAQYDRHGAGHFDNRSQHITNAARNLFSSRSFAPYIGMVQVSLIAVMFDPSNEEGLNLTMKDIAQLQRAREVKLANQLVERLQPFVEGDEEARQRWKDQMEHEGSHLADDFYSFGEQLVHHIGWVYSNCAARHSGSLLSYVPFMACDSCAHTTGMKIEFLGKVNNASRQTLRYLEKQKKLKKEEIDPAENKDNLPPEDYKQQFEAEAQQEWMEVMMDTVAHYTLLDVEETVTNVCYRILTDTNLDTETRYNRSEALAIVGRAFQDSRREHADHVPWSHIVQEAANSPV